MEIIRADNVTKIYDTGEVRVEALRGLTLSIQRGEMVAVMGPSGCGKTTLLNCLSGIDDVTSGTVTIEGTRLDAMNDRARTHYRAQRMGFVFQLYNLLPVLTAIENVELPLLLGGTSPARARQQAAGMLATVGLEGWEGHKPAQLSGGQRQRVTVARALVNKPAIVWADEPTGDLDSKMAEEVMDIMCELNRTQNQTFVVVTHAQRVAARAHRTLIMADGRVVNEVANDSHGANKANETFEANEANKANETFEASEANKANETFEPNKAQEANDINKEGSPVIVPDEPSKKDDGSEKTPDIAPEA